MGMQINASQTAGLIAFVPAALATFGVFLREGCSARRKRSTWAVIATIYALLSVEMLVDERWRIKGAIDQWLKSSSLYADRRPVQVASLILLAIIAALALGRLIRAGNDRVRIARLATAALVAVFMVEAVSLHAVDAILFRQVGPVMLIALLWIACGWTTTFAALGRLPKVRRR